MPRVPDFMPSELAPLLVKKRPPKANSKWIDPHRDALMLFSLSGDYNWVHPPFAHHEDPRHDSHSQVRRRGARRRAGRRRWSIRTGRCAPRRDRCSLATQPWIGRSRPTPRSSRSRVRRTLRGGLAGRRGGREEGETGDRSDRAELPAEIAGLQEGDQVTAIDGEPTGNAAAVRDVLRGKLAGDQVALTVSRAGKTIQAKATLLATSRPMNVANTTRVVMGVTLGNPGKGGITIDEVTASGPAEQGGIKAGDVVLSIDGRSTQTDTAFRDSLANKLPGDRVNVVYLRGGKQMDTKVTVVPEEPERKGRRGFGGGGGWDDRSPAPGASRATSSPSSASSTRT